MNKRIKELMEAILLMQNILVEEMNKEAKNEKSKGNKERN